MPRIPFAPDFGAFRDAGAELAALHLGYETCPEYELQVEVGPGPNPYQLGAKTMQWGGTKKQPDRSVLHVTPSVTLSGMVNDPNAWFAADPAELVAHLKRLVHVSVETTRIVGGLPPALTN